jgi:hypothetical protein
VCFRSIFLSSRATIGYFSVAYYSLLVIDLPVYFIFIPLRMDPGVSRQQKTAATRRR